ncbi:hypothetical protein ACYOEI_20725, partial [Singulisphaera rosea]
MPPKRANSKSSASPSSSGTSSPPLVTALMVAAALSYGLGLLVMKGRVNWPPHQLMASIYTVAGCLAMVGPFVLARVESSERGLGEL